MSRVLAIDWDAREARAVLVAKGATGGAKIDGAWAVAVDAADGAGNNNRQTGARLAAAIARRPLGKVTTVIGVGRDQAQLKLLSLPPAPADELPDLVRFQAEREFTALGEGAVLDFIPLAGDAQTPHQVLAASLRAAGANEVRDLCQQLDVEPERITLRACAAASLVRRTTSATSDNVAVVINPLADEADLAALVGDVVVLARTVRLPAPSDAEARLRTLGGEIRRTMAVVRQQATESQVDTVWLCGGVAANEEAAALSKELNLKVTPFDPVKAGSLSLGEVDVSEQSLGRFAAVLGMALDEADRRPPAIDFLHPKRKAQKRKFSRVHALALGAAAMAVLAIGLRLWSQASQPLNELARVQKELQDLQPVVRQYDAVTAQATAVENWLATDVNWLDEFVEIGKELRPMPLASKEYPVDQDVVIKQLTLSIPPGTEARGGLVDLEAVAKTAAVVATLESRMRDETHQMEAGGGKQDRTTPGYDWAFGLRVNVEPQEASDEEAAP